MTETTGALVIGGTLNGLSIARSLGRPVRRAHQRAGHDAREAHREGLLAQRDELVGVHPAVDRVVPRGRPQVLGDRRRSVPAARRSAMAGRDLLAGLAHAEDQVGLGHQARLVRLAEHVERALVAEAGPDPLEDPRHRLQVVREHLGPGAEHLAELVGVGVEVGDQQLDPAAGHGGVDLPGGLRVQPGPAVGLVVAGDPGDGRVAQPHGGDGLGDAARLVAVKRQRLAGVDLAEVAPPGALVPADQEGRLAVFPALEDVRAAGLLADRVQPLGLDAGAAARCTQARCAPGS